MNLNRVVLAGNLARDPDLRFLPSGTPKCTLTMAVSRPPDKQGERMTDFLTVIAWRKQAQTLGEYARKGEALIIEGRLQARDFTTEDGTKRHVVEVLLTDFSFVGNDQGDEDGDGGEYEEPEHRAPRRAPREATLQRVASRRARTHENGERSRAPRRPAKRTQDRPAPSRSESMQTNPPDDPAGEDVPF